MNELQNFNFNGSQVRALTIDNEPWFVATDACKILGLKNTTVALQRLDKDERSKLNLGRQGKTNIVNEYGLYTLILASRKPEAHKFKRWITHEVLPAINKHGAYMTDAKAEAIVTDKNALADLLQQASDQLKEKDIQIAEMRPKALFADAITESHTSILVGDLAKILRQNGIEIGARRLFKWLRENHYLISRKGSDYNSPTQRSMEMGLFEIKESSHINGNGVNVITKTPKVTGKGQKYFMNKFLESE
ncbi:phage antirepressor [Ligilactobacillus cholophilus]|uniref:phage antirepressor n=1 Tax=Ligilactobacillus cholophilus TaxID=3050131 RepID=UPI0025AEF4CE|nr:phage antirepressor [Ligilactobacillus cholophilus]